VDDVYSKVLCDGCGHLFTVAEDYSRSKIQCPECGVMCQLPVRESRPARKKAPSTAPPVPAKSRGSGRRAPQIPPTSFDVEGRNGDDDPFGMNGEERTIPCPGCHRPLPTHAIVCKSCGFDQRIGRKATKSFEPTFQQWDSGLPLGRRLRTFIITQLVIQPLMISGLINPDLPWGGDTFGLMFPAILGSILLLLLLGTFDRTTLYRNSHGDVHLSKLWRVGFLRMPVHEVPLDQYDRVRVNLGKGPDSGDWLLLVALFVFGIIPGIIWLYTVILRPGYQVTLGSIGRLDDEILYRGTDLHRAEEIGHSVSDLTSLRYDGL
jgi:hypothetical protein